LAGAPEAVADAMRLCREFSKSPPPWLVEAVSTLAGHVADDKAKRKWDMIHFERWDAVRELRDRKGERGIPTTWDECYEEAAALLGVSAATVKASYQRVREHMTSGRGKRYYVSSSRRKVG
jgi:hypothetical protein